MSQCKSSIVECLRQKGVEPLATASSERSSNEAASTALVYNTNYYFHTNYDGSYWWKVDFKQYVSINTYQIQTDAVCAFVRKWRILLSNNDKDWSIVHTPKEEENWPQGKNYTLSKTYVTRYFKIEKLADNQGCTNIAFYYIKFFGSTAGKKDRTFYKSRSIEHYIFRLIFINCS